MSGYKDNGLVNGFDVVRSLAKAREEAARTTPSRERAPQQEVRRPPVSATLEGSPHIGKTVRPPQRTVRCFHCGYEFKISGTAPALYCGKCREKIDMGDYTVSGTWRENIQTGGTVRVTEGGMLAGATVRAGNVILEGGMDEASRVECTQWLELRGQGAAPDPRQWTARNLRVGSGVVAEWRRKVSVHNAEIAGTLEADLEATGLVEVLDGGHLKGTVRGAHLRVEEGGGLTARVFIWPPEGEGK